MTKKSVFRIYSSNLLKGQGMIERIWAYLGMGQRCRPWVMFAHVTPCPCRFRSQPFEHPNDLIYLRSKLSSGRAAWWENSTLQSSSLYSDLAWIEQNAAVCWAVWRALGGDVLLIRGFIDFKGIFSDLFVIWIVVTILGIYGCLLGLQNAIVIYCPWLLWLLGITIWAIKQLNHQSLLRSSDLEKEIRTNGFVNFFEPFGCIVCLILIRQRLSDM